MFRSHSSDRRAFLRAFGTVSAAAATGALPLAAAPDANAYDPGRSETGVRYRAESPDVQAFYRTNGYETVTR